MFKASIEASVIADALNSVSVLVDECKINFTDDGLRITAVDPANVGMVDLDISAPAFESFEVGDGVIGVNLNRLEDVVGMANSDDLITFELDEETRKLNIDSDGLSFTLALINPDSIRKEPDIPDLNLPAEVVMTGEQLSRGVKAADMVSDHIKLRVDESEEVFYIEAEGDTDDVDLTLDTSDLVSMVPGAADSLFSLDYLKDMNKAIPKDAELELNLGEEFPVKMYFATDDGLTNVTYMLAPRIQSS